MNTGSCPRRQWIGVRHGEPTHHLPRHPQRGTELGQQGFGPCARPRRWPRPPRRCRDRSSRARSPRRARSRGTVSPLRISRPCRGRERKLRCDRRLGFEKPALRLEDSDIVLRHAGKRESAASAPAPRAPRGASRGGGRDASVPSHQGAGGRADLGDAGHMEQPPPGWPLRVRATARRRAAAEGRRRGARNIPAG